MAELFLASAEGAAGFQRTCVVKRILPHLAEDPSFVHMFLDEARLAAQLHHPGIVQIFELGREGEDYYFAMEYLAGENWAAVARQSQEKHWPVPLDVAARLARDAAVALHHAHEMTDESGKELELVHRDVSPSNLLVTYQGLVKVLDFGIARAASTSRRTETGHIKGKVGYMAPEQALGQPVDRRADVWALGVCLHELITGRRLFSGDSLAEVALKVCQADIPRPSSLRPGISPQLESAVMGALNRNVASRFSTAAAFGSALDEATRMESERVDLAAYLEDLFGSAQKEARLRVLRRPTPAGPGTQVLAPVEGSTTTLVEPLHRPQRSPAAALVLLLGAVGVVGLVSTFALTRTKVETAPQAHAQKSAPQVAQTKPPAVTSPVKSGSENAPLTATDVVETAPGPGPDAKPAAASAAALVSPVPGPRPTHPAEPPRRKSRPQVAAAQGHGTLTLVTQPYATVEWNARELGTTPLFDVPLPVGKQTLRLRGSDGKRRRLVVEVPRGALTTLRVHLDRLPVD
jgi:serine/threonine-protein kinase